MRIRTIKPEFWLHEGLCSCSEFARLLAIALLNWSDDEGYFMAHPSLIRGSLFPFLDDSKNIPRSLQDLSRVGWIELGKDDQGRPVGRVTNFLKHQRIDKPQASKIKGSSVFLEHSKNDLGTILDDSKGEWNGMDQGIGKGSLTESAPPPPLDGTLKLEPSPKPPKIKKPKADPPDPRREEFVSIFREFIESGGVTYDRPNAADNAQLKTLLNRKHDLTAEQWREYLLYIHEKSHDPYSGNLIKDCGSLALVCSKMDRIQTYKDRDETK